MPSYDGRIAALEGLHEKLSSLQRDFIQNRSKAGRAGMIKPDAAYAMELAQSFTERAKRMSTFEDAHRFAENGGFKKLYTAEYTAREAWWAVHYEQNTGIHSRTGILEDVRHQFREVNFRGGKDKDTFRQNWNEYKGVAHLGAAMMVATELEIEGRDIVLLAEEIRHTLSHECPKGQRKPYVQEREQICFLLDTEL